MTRRIVEGSYARLVALRDSAIYVMHESVPRDFADDYMTILTALKSQKVDDFLNFELTSSAFRDTRDPKYQIWKDAFLSKVRQLISYLEMVHHASSRIVEIGSTYNLIRDPELKSRCSDLLSASDHFDRVINQATQVLEERLRQKIPEFASDVGIVLVGKAINGELTKTRIRFSDNSSEQEGYANIFRGLIGAFRNPSHHRFLENVTREQALQICAFIDNMLAALETAEIVTA
jgi:uncharacterized protein (TIGR02391 family)